MKENVYEDMSEFGTFVNKLGIVFTSGTPERVEGFMPISEDVRQPWGFLHGGATISLLESLASHAAELRADLETERPFGVEVDVRHCKPGRSGVLHGYAQLDRVERNKQYWEVVATDDEGDVVSEGVIMTKIVSLERLAEKERERQAAKA